MKRIIFPFLFIILFNNNLLAIYPLVHNYSRKSSNAGTQNWDIIQHQNNWMYFANNSGLLEFDGYDWSIYPIANYTNVRSLCYDAGNERIYAGAFNEFGYYSRNERGILGYHSLVDKLPSIDKPFNEIWSIHQTNDALYFQGDKEIFRYKSDQIKRFDFSNKINCSAMVHQMLLISDLTDGVSVLNGDLFISLPGSDILKGKKVCAILPFGEKEILFITDFHGMFIFDGQNTTVFQTDIDPFLIENQVFCATIKGSKLAIGTVRNGLVVKDLQTNSTIYANVNSGLQNNTILSLAFDFQNNLWLGLDKGIDYVMINLPIYDLFGNNMQFGAGYTSVIQNNLLYLGTNQGLYLTSYPIVTSPDPFNIRLVDHISGQVWQLTDIDNTIFCGTDRGLFMVNENRAEQIPEVTGTWKVKVLESHPGYILGSSYKGFFILKKENNRWKFSHMIKGFSDSGGMFEEDKNGDIWFCHWIKGVSKLTLNEAADSVSVETFDTSKGFYTNRNIVLFKIDNEIVFSSDGGFYEYDESKDSIIHTTKIESIFGNLPHSVHLSQMPNGDIWCVSNNSLSVAFLQPDKTFKMNNTSFSSLKNRLIIGFEDFNFVNDSSIILSTEDGFSWLDVQKAKTDADLQNPFKLSICNIYITGERDSLVGGYYLQQKTIPEFDYKNNSIRFEFVAPEYRDDQSITYSYKLENYDSDWSSYSFSNTKEYTKLPKGSYVFKVRAQNALESEIVETSYHFVILPPWYESGPALAVYAILIMFLFFQLVVFIKKRSEKAAQKMKIQKEKEMQEQEERFNEDTKKKEKEIVALKNQRLQYELRHKSQELASSTMNLIRKNEILLEINKDIEKIASEIKGPDESSGIKKKLTKMQNDIKQNIERDDNWKKFAENFDMIYENFLKRLGEQFPSLTVSDKKLCAYLKMGLSSKDIAPLLNMSFRSVEMSRYRLRKKLDLYRDMNLSDFLQNF